MTPGTLLALIADLYQQILDLRSENEGLRAALAAQTDKAVE